MNVETYAYHLQAIELTPGVRSVRAEVDVDPDGKPRWSIRVWFEDERRLAITDANALVALASTEERVPQLLADPTATLFTLVNGRTETIHDPDAGQE